MIPFEVFVVSKIVTDKTKLDNSVPILVVFVVSKIVTDKTLVAEKLGLSSVFVVSKIVTDKTLMKKPSENQRADLSPV